MTKDLTNFVQAIWNSKDVEIKRSIAAEMIEASHATSQTKAKAMADIADMNARKLDFFASNYSLSGEGNKVI